MRANRPVDPPELGEPVGYTNGYLVPPDRRLLFVAGQVGWDAEQRIVSPRFDEQFARALDNILAVVRSAGGSPADVVRMLVFVADLEAYRRARPSLGAIWRERFGRHYPAMSLVQVAGLLEEGALVEIEATAAIPPQEEEEREEE